MKVGEKKQLQVPGMAEGLVEVSLPNEYSFLDMNHQYPPPEDFQYIKPFHLDLQPGDCVYIPGYWWFQIKANYPKNPKKSANAEQKAKFKDSLKPLSISVDFWYSIQSL